MTADRLDGLQRSIHLPQPYVLSSIKSVEDIYDLLSILVFLAAVDEISLDMLQAGMILIMSG